MGSIKYNTLIEHSHRTFKIGNYSNRTVIIITILLHEHDVSIVGETTGWTGAW